MQVSYVSLWSSRVGRATLTLILTVIFPILQTVDNSRTGSNSQLGVNASCHARPPSVPGTGSGPANARQAVCGNSSRLAKAANEAAHMMLLSQGGLYTCAPA